MEWGVVGGIVVAIIIGAWKAWQKLQPDVRAEGKENERQRKRQRWQLRRAFEFGDLVDEHLHQLRRDRRRHDDEHHPDGEGAIGVPAIPPEIDRGIRAYVRDDDSEED